ncbi:MAG: InlB B-repeat-containing protein, partial [Lachnospiraceae bacterium]|nr:InlB B-repeat-containing protein [Lachnospiraceae bacterium]
MGKGSNKRFLSVLLCLLMVVGLVAPLSTERAEAATSVSISKNGSVTKSISYGQYTYNVTLKDAYTGLQVYKDSWITYKLSGSTYVVTVTANSGNAQRKGSILFKETRNGQVSTWELKITQAGKPTPTPSKTPTPTPKMTANTTSISFGNGAESKNVTISNRTGTLSVSSVSWVSYSVSGSTVTLTSARNTGSSRSGTITIKDGSGQSVKISVSQKAAPTPTPTKTPTPTPTKTPTPTPKMTANTTSITFGAGGESRDVTITAGRTGTLSVTGVSWITASVNGSKVTLTASKNTGASRSGTITIKDSGSKQTVAISVSQKAAPTPTPTPKPTSTPTPRPTLKLSQTTITFGSEGGEKSITATTGQRATFRADRNTDAMWLTARVNESTITFVAPKNTGAARSGTVSITDTISGLTANVKVYQSAAPTPTATNTPTPTPRMAANPSSLTFGSGSEQKKVTITGATGTLSVSGVSWVTADIKGLTITFTSAKNTGTGRSGKIIIRDSGSKQSVTIPVSQKAGPTPTPTRKPDKKMTYTVGWNAGSLDIPFDNPLGNKPHVIGTDGDVSFTVKINGTTVRVTIPANNSYSTRIFKVIVVDGEENQIEITIIQEGKPEPTKTPTPTNTPTPTPTPTNTPTPTPKPPRATSTSTPTPKPTKAVSPSPAVSKAPSPQITKAPSPQPTSSPKTPSPVPSNITPGPTGNITPMVTSTPAPTGVPVIVTPSQNLFARPSKLHYGSYVSANDTILLSLYTDASNLDAKVESDTVGWLHVYKVPDKEGQFVVEVDENYEGKLRSGEITFFEKGTEKTVVVPVSQRGRVVSILFKANGGTWPGDITKEFPIGCTYGKLVEKPTAPEGMEFSGWYTSPEGGELIREEDTVSPYITTLYAQYVSTKTVTVSFDINGGDEKSGKYKSTSIRVGETYGKILFKPTHPDSKLRFAYWADETGKEITEDDVVKRTTDHTLKAIWEEPTYYLVRFKGNGNWYGEMEEMRCEYGKTYPYPIPKFDDGIGFEGWSTTPDGSDPPYTEGDLQFTDKNTRVFTLYALWYERGTLYYHDGFTGEVRPYAEKMKHVFLVRGEKDNSWVHQDGLKFVGWSTDPEDLIGGTVEYQANSYHLCEGDLHLYPVYKTEESGAYVVIYSNEGGIGGPRTTVYSADKKSIHVSTKIPIRNHYDFEGWQVIVLSNVDPNTPVGWNMDDLGWVGDCVAITLKPGQKIDEDWFGENNTVVLKAKWSFRKTELKLVDPFDNSSETIKVDDSEFKLPSPKRNGYRFLGWCVDNKADASVVYYGDTKYFIPEEIKTLYAKWEKATFTVEIYDPFTDKVLMRYTATMDDKLPGEQYSVNGMHFTGWSDQDVSRKNFEDREKTILRLIEASPKANPGDPFSKLTITDVVTISPCYSFDEEYDGGITVVYIADKATNVPSVENHPRKNVVTSTLTPQRDGCKFAGWRRTPNEVYGEILYKENKQVPISSEYRSSVLFLYAAWDPQVHITLNPNHSGAEPFELDKRFLPGDYVAARDLCDIEYQGHYLRGWKTADESLVVSLKDSFTIPDKDTTLYAVWGEDQYTVYYHDGFSLSVIESQQVFGCEADLTYFASDIPGFRFTGWKEGDNGGLEAFDRTPRYTKQNPRIEFTDDVHLYSCYEKAYDGSEDKIIVLYNPMGGEGGPGVDEVPVGKKIIIRDEEPTRKGFEFVGWSVSSFMNSPVDARYRRGAECEETPQNGVIDLYAVWRPDTTNELKY